MERGLAQSSDSVGFGDYVHCSKGLSTMVGLATACFVLLRLFVKGNVFSRVWAEDGKIFLGDAHAHGLSSLLYTYSGYASELPRGIALIGSWLPLDFYSTYCVLASVLVSALVATFVFDRAFRYIHLKRWAVAAALVVGLEPALRVESLGNIANLPWILIYAAFWAILAEGYGDSLSRQIVTMTVVFAAGISTPLTLLVFPAFLVKRRWWRQHRSSIVAICAALAIQVGLIAFGLRSVVIVVHHPSISILMLEQSLLGLAGSLPLPNYVNVLIAICIGTGISYVLYRLRRQRDVVAAMAAGFLLLVVTAGLSGGVPARYASTADFFAVAGLTLAATHLSIPLRRLMAAGMVSAVVIGFPATGYRLSGPSWDVGVASYNRGCAHGLRDVEIPLSPAGWGALTLSCPKASTAPYIENFFNRERRHSSLDYFMPHEFETLQSS